MLPIVERINRAHCEDVCRMTGLLPKILLGPYDTHRASISHINVVTYLTLPSRGLLTLLARTRQ